METRRIAKLEEEIDRLQRCSTPFMTARVK
jgi:hypothetical protein